MPALNRLPDSDDDERPRSRPAAPPDIPAAALAKSDANTKSPRIERIGAPALLAEHRNDRAMSGFRLFMVARHVHAFL